MGVQSIPAGPFRCCNHASPAEESRAQRQSLHKTRVQFEFWALHSAKYYIITLQWFLVTVGQTWDFQAWHLRFEFWGDVFQGKRLKARGVALWVWSMIGEQGGSKLLEFLRWNRQSHSQKFSKTEIQSCTYLIFVFHDIILLMEEILHQLIGSLHHYLQGFIHPRWCRISSINSINKKNAQWNCGKHGKHMDVPLRLQLCRFQEPLCGEAAAQLIYEQVCLFCWGLPGNHWESS